MVVLMNELEQLIIEEGINIQIFIANEITDDLNYNNKSISYLNSFPQFFRIFIVVR